MNREFSFLERVINSSNTGDLEYTLRSAQLEPADLQGKRILNIGAGKVDLQKELDQRGIEAQVVNVDRAYNPLKRARKFFYWRVDRKEIPRPAIRGDFKKLPFRDGSFDIAFASQSVGSFPFKRNVKLRGISEMIRVSQDSYIFPMEEPDYKSLFQKGKNELPKHRVKHLSSTDAVHIQPPLTYRRRLR